MINIVAFFTSIMIDARLIGHSGSCTDLFHILTLHKLLILKLVYKLCKLNFSENIARGLKLSK